MYECMMLRDTNVNCQQRHVKWDLYFSCISWAGQKAHQDSREPSDFHLVINAESTDLEMEPMSTEMSRAGDLDCVKCSQEAVQVVEFIIHLIQDPMRRAFQGFSFIQVKELLTMYTAIVKMSMTWIPLQVALKLENAQRAW